MPCHEGHAMCIIVQVMHSLYLDSYADLLLLTWHKLITWLQPCCACDCVHAVLSATQSVMHMTKSWCDES